MTQNGHDMSPREGNAAFVHWIAKWALTTSLLLLAFDIAILRNYPFPRENETLRAAFYSMLGAGLVIASLIFAFLGYRIVTLRYTGRAKAVYLIFLPPVLLVTSLVWLLLLAGAA